MVNSEQPSLPPLARLLLAYAPKAVQPWHELCWQLDQRFAAVVRRQGDPTITAIRLAWWDSVLVEQDPSKGVGEPLVEQWRALAGESSAQAVERLIDGWRVLASPDALSEQDLLDYAQTRGGGFFALLASEKDAGDDESVTQHGAIWALWDLAGHMRDEAQAARAMKVAKELADQAGRMKLPAHTARPIRLLAAIALADVNAARVPSEGFTLRHYARLLITGLLG